MAKRSVASPTSSIVRCSVRVKASVLPTCFLSSYRFAPLTALSFTAEIGLFHDIKRYLLVHRMDSSDAIHTLALCAQRIISKRQEGAIELGLRSTEEEAGPYNGTC